MRRSNKPFTGEREREMLTKREALKPSIYIQLAFNLVLDVLIITLSFTI
jgi:hypothetical protein